MLEIKSQHTYDLRWAIHTKSDTYYLKEIVSKCFLRISTMYFWNPQKVRYEVDVFIIIFNIQFDIKGSNFSIVLKLVHTICKLDKREFSIIIIDMSEL